MSQQQSHKHILHAASPYVWGRPLCDVDDDHTQRTRDAALVTCAKCKREMEKHRARNGKK